MGINRVLDVYKEAGFKEILAKIKKRFYIKSYEYRVMLEDVDSTPSDLFFIKEINLSRLDQMANQYKEEINEKKYRLLKQRIVEKSSDCPYAVLDHNHEVYGYYHIAYEENFNSSIQVEVENIKENIYLFDDYTFIDQRGKGAQTYAVKARLLLGQSKGYKTASVHIQHQNAHSRRAYESLGFKKIKTLRYYKFLGFQKTTVSKRDS